MYYCENCNIKSETQRCPRCGKRNLREIQDDDFCFCCQMSAGAAEELKRHLETQNIDCALIPYGTGLNARRAMASESALVFVQYKGLAYVAELFAQEAKHQLEKLQQEIVPHLDKLFIFEKDAKRVIKQLKLPKDTDIVELGKSIILGATTGEDTGLIGCDEDDVAYGIGHVDGHYYCFANDTYEVWLNSETFRIYKVKKV